MEILNGSLNYYNVEQCFKNQETCEGGWLVGDSLCKSGYLGGLCEECDKYNQRGYGVYFRQKKATICNLCDSYSVSILPFIATSIWAIVSNLLTLISINKSNKLFSALKLRQRFAKIIFKYEQDHESILIKLFLNYLWIFSIIFTFNITFSFSFSFIDQTSNPSHFMANSLDCYLQLLTEYELIYVRISLNQIKQIIQIQFEEYQSIIYKDQLMMYKFLFQKMKIYLHIQQLQCSYLWNVKYYQYILDFNLAPQLGEGRSTQASSQSHYSIYMYQIMLPQSHNFVLFQPKDQSQKLTMSKEMYLQFMEPNPILCG